METRLHFRTGTSLDVTYSSYDRTAIRSWLDAITVYQQTSAVRTVKSENASNNVFYSLNGQKVTEPRKVIYIVASSPAFRIFNGESGQ